MTDQQKDDFITRWVTIFSNTKFIFINTVILIILLIALVAGDAKRFLFHAYETITGQKVEHYEAMIPSELANEGYLILLDTLSRQHIDTQNLYVELFKASPSKRIYRIQQADKSILYYSVEVQENGRWHIYQNGD